jgi:homocysteine S-methyltransferase
MTLEQTIQSHEITLTEGAIIELLRRDQSFKLDPHIMHAEFAFDPDRRRALAQLYRDYIDIAAAFDLPIIVGTPTWRASPERVEQATHRSCSAINKEAVRFLLAVRSEYRPFSQRISIAGLLGCKGDAYDPAESLSAEDAAEYHEEQCAALARTGVDLLLAATLPSAREAHGMAAAMSRHGIPYILSFVLRPSGVLLDGTPLHEVISSIDAGADPPPLCYWANCVHPTVFADAMRQEAQVMPSLGERLIGLQANTSPLSPEDLEGSATLQTEDPSSFAASMLQLNEAFGTKVLGGCCGTGPAHIRHLAAQIQKRKQEKHDSR